MNAIIYCRVSTAEQTKNLSLPTQRAECRRYCAAQGYRVVAEFIEEGESAKTADRPVLQKLLEYCRKNRGKVSMLAVYNVTRFARDRYDHAVLRSLLLKLGITLRSVTEPIDDSPTGQLMEGILAAFAEFDNNQKSARTKVGMTAALERGRWTFVPPVGYRSGLAGGPSLVRDPEASQIIRSAFESLAAEHGSPAAVLKQVTALGLRSRVGRPLSLQSFHNLLKNPLYAGRVTVKKWGIDRQGDFEPIVAPSLFDTVQLILRGGGQRRVRHHRTNVDFPLRRFVRCGPCGELLTGSWSRGRSGRYAYYHCVNCGGVRVPGERLESQFMELLEALRPDPVFARLFEAVVRDVWNDREASSSRAFAAAEGRLRGVRQRLTEVDRAFVIAKTIDSRSYYALRDSLREEQALAEMALKEARIDELDIEAALAASEAILSNAAELWRRASIEQRHKLQAAIFPEGLTHDGRDFGTAVTCVAFRGLQALARMTEGVASPTGF